MNMHNFLYLAIVTLAIALPTVAQAKPTYQQAKAIYDAMGKTIDQSGIWFQKDRTTRIGLAREAGSLVKKSEQVFGSDPLTSPYRSCLQAVLYHQDYVSHLNTLADVVQGTTSSPSPVALFSSFPNAARFGEARAWCFSEIEELTNKK